MENSAPTASLDELLQPLMESIASVAISAGQTPNELILMAVERAVLEEQIREGQRSPKEEAITDFSAWAARRVERMRAGINEKRA